MKILQNTGFSKFIFTTLTRRKIIGAEFGAVCRLRSSCVLLSLATPTVRMSLELYFVGLPWKLSRTRSDSY